ncbi:hypothetical protein BJY14_000703 [Actinomadura luteofluorescens]|uniref:Uncharacterized protein n=1 Tax=Actinomadura luteofluorescens TaxID=46163 RepID=A0A7Y9EC82_9ACTN|nr:hypothetical protein [Actinomadura luteofluorescens]NYD44720.1 hypothetical protein [Actinomadura luteofluorescens]
MSEARRHQADHAADELARFTAFEERGGALTAQTPSGDGTAAPDRVSRPPRSPPRPPLKPAPAST